MRVAYDARMALGHFRGMGSYLRRLIEPHRKDFLGFCATGETDPDLRLRSKGFHSYPLWEQVSLARRVREEKIDFFLAPFNTAPLYLPHRARLIVVVHDLIFFEPLPKSASSYQNAGRLYRRLIVPRAVKRADLVVTVSQYVHDELRDRFALNPEKLVVLPNSIDSSWYCHKSALETKDNYILLVSGEAPSKNLSAALEACARSSSLRNLGCRITILGVKKEYFGRYREQAQRLSIEHLVDFLEYVPRSELQQIYRRAFLFLMPSLAEGFGIPLLEAMASGTPVVASNVSCLPEIAGEAAIYFNPGDPEDMANSIDQMLSSRALRYKMQKAGYEQAQRYHPEKIRKQIQHFWDLLLT